MRTRRFVPWLLVASFALGGVGIGSVLAQDPNWPPPETCKPSNKDTQDAKTLFGLGKSSFQTASYADAIKYWKDAYRRDCTAPLILKYIGQAYEADAQYANAVDVYKLFRLRGKPTGDELDQLDQKIANLSKKIPGASTTDTATTSTTTTTTTTTTSPSSTTTSTTTATVSASTTATVEPPKTGGSRPIAPLIVGIAGGGVGLIGGALWFVGNSSFKKKADDFSSLKCNTGPLQSDVSQCQSIASDANSAKHLRTFGIITAGVGVTAGAVGLILYFLSKPTEAKTGSLVVTPGPGMAGIGLSGAF